VSATMLSHFQHGGHLAGPCKKHVKHPTVCIQQCATTGYASNWLLTMQTGSSFI